MTYNKNVKKYIKQFKYLFASYGKSEKEYIRKLIDNASLVLIATRPYFIEFSKCKAVIDILMN